MQSRILCSLLLAAWVSACGDASAEYSAEPNANGSSAAKLTSTNPTTGETGVYLDRTLFLEFSDPIQPGSISLTMTPAHPLGTPVVSHGGKLVSVQPSTPLAPNTTYKVAVVALSATTRPVNTSASFTFTTGTDIQQKSNASTSGPSLAATTPANGATLIPVPTSISLLFSRPMNQATVRVVAEPAADLGAGSWSPESQMLTFPSANLQAGVRYVISASGSDTTQVPLLGTTSFAFTTQPAELSLPAVSANIPAQGAIGVAPETVIAVTFTKPMDRAATQAAFTPAAVLSGTFSWNDQSTVMTFQPTTPFGYGQVVSWTVTTAAKDATGKAIAAAYNASFRVARLATADLPAVAALDGWVSSVGGLVNTSDVTTKAGDGANRVYRTFLTFDLNALSTDTLRVVSATLSVYQASFIERPYTFLGVLQADSVDYGNQLDAGDWNTPVLTTLQCSGNPQVCTRAPETRQLGNAPTTGYLALQSTLKVQEDWAMRSIRSGRSQYRLMFSVDDRNKDQYDDQAFFNTAEAASNRPFLRVEYEYK